MAIKRIGILSNLVSTLQGIDGTGSYTTTISNVFTHTRTWNEVDATIRPAACVHLGSEEYEYEAFSGTEGNIRVSMTVDLLFYLDASTEATRLAAIDNLLDDVWIALHTDDTRGGNAISTTILSAQTDEPDIDGQESLRVTLLIVYDRNTGVSS